MVIGVAPPPTLQTSASEDSVWGWGSLRIAKFRNEESTQRGSLWLDVLADIRPKPSVRSSKTLKNKHFGPDMPRGCPRRNFQESAKGAGGKGARVINCHNFFFTPESRQGNKENRPHNNGRHSRTKNATICDPGPLYAGPLSALLKLWSEKLRADSSFPEKDRSYSVVSKMTTCRWFVFWGHLTPVTDAESCCQRDEYPLQRQICGMLSTKSLIADADSSLNSN